MITMVTLILSMMPLTSMAYDDMSKWDRYALAMPISKKDIVLSKYILSILLSLVSILVSFIITYLFILPRSDMGRSELLLVAYIIFSISLVYVSIVLPLIYKFGVEKTRIITMCVFAIPTMMVFAFYKMGLQLPSKKQLLFLLKVSPLILILILICSALFSYITYKNKDI